MNTEPFHTTHAVRGSPQKLKAGISMIKGADLHAFIEALNLNNITLVGWSYGTLDQFAYISQFGTDKLDGAVTVDRTVKTVGEDNTKEWVG